MIAFLAAFLRLFFLALGSKRVVLSRNARLEKEDEILLRRLGKRGFITGSPVSCSWLC
jgi:hypothetical protein